MARTKMTQEEMEVAVKQGMIAKVIHQRYKGEISFDEAFDLAEGMDSVHQAITEMELDKMLVDDEDDADAIEFEFEREFIEEFGEVDKSPEENKVD